jgi:hypothetical protein
LVVRNATEQAVTITINDGQAARDATVDACAESAIPFEPATDEWSISVNGEEVFDALHGEGTSPITLDVTVDGVGTWTSDASPPALALC